MDSGDIFAITEAIALGGTWYWEFRRRSRWVGKRRKLAIYSLVFASIAVLIDLALSAIMHFHSSPDDLFAAKAFAVSLLLVMLFSVAGLSCGVVGRGTPRISGLVWSILMLVQVAITFMAGFVSS